MRENGLGIEERFILTAQELEYSDVEDENEELVDRAVSLLYSKVSSKDFEFTDEERELLEDAFVAVSNQ